MRIGIPIWNGRISPVFDVSQHLLSVDIENGKVISQDILTIGRAPLYERTVLLKGEGVECILCGAISNAFLNQLNMKDIQVYPWLSGSTEEILAAFIDGTLNQPRFFMPGCCRRMQRMRFGKGRRHNNQ